MSKLSYKDKIKIYKLRKNRKINPKVAKSIHVTSDEWIEFPNYHKPLVSEEDFNFVQDIIYKRDNKVNKQGEYNIFSGHLICADCGNSITPKKNSTGNEYYCNIY